MNKIKELYKKYKEIINYLIFGVLTTIVSLAVYYGLTLTVLNPDKAVELQIANVVSWIAAVTFRIVNGYLKIKKKLILKKQVSFIYQEYQHY